MKYFKKTTLFVVAALLNGCASDMKTSENLTQLHAPQQTGSLYIVVDRNPRLPEGFTEVFRQETQKRLPMLHVTVDEGAVRDHLLEQADRVISLRATRVVPNYTFKPSDNSDVKGLSDCFWGGGFGFGWLFGPCIYGADSDFLEASIRDGNGKTLKTYVVEESGEDWILAWVPTTMVQPLLKNKDQTQIWIDLTDALYDKILGDGVLSRAE
jgi:hypothetical protein